MELSVSGTRSKTLCGHSNLNRTALKLYVGDLEPITGVVRRNFHMLFEYPGALPRLRLLKPASFRLRRLSGKRGSYQPVKGIIDWRCRRFTRLGVGKLGKEKGKNEESYIKHGVGVGGPVGVGPGIGNNDHHD